MVVENWFGGGGEGQVGCGDAGLEGLMRARGMVQRWWKRVGKRATRRRTRRRIVFVRELRVVVRGLVLLLLVGIKEGGFLGHELG